MLNVNTQNENGRRGIPSVGNTEREKSNRKKGRLWGRKRRRTALVVGLEVVGSRLTRRSRGGDEEKGEGNYPTSHDAHVWDRVHS